MIETADAQARIDGSPGETALPGATVIAFRGTTELDAGWAGDRDGAFSRGRQVGRGKMNAEGRLALCGHGKELAHDG